MRLNIVTLVIGMPGTGKTTTLKKLIKQNSKKALIIDEKDDPSWKNIPRVPPHALNAWKKGTKRIFEPDIKEVLALIAKHVRNAILVFDDASGYLDYFREKNLRRILIDRRHYNLDIFFTFHSLSMCSIDIYNNANYILLFKTNDTEKRIKKLEKLPCGEKILKAFSILQKEKDKHKNILINLL